MKEKNKYFFILFSLMILLIMPKILPQYYTDLLIEVYIFGLFCLGFDIIFGFTGLLNFGTSAFFGLGGYSVLLSILHWHTGIWLTLLITIIVSTIFSLIYGMLVTRFKSHYFVAFTIVVSMILFYFAMSHRSITGADEGLTFEVPPLNLGITSLNLNNTSIKYYFILLVCGITFTLIWNFFQKNTGF